MSAIEVDRADEGDGGLVVTALIDITSQVERHRMLELMAEVNTLVGHSPDEDSLLQGLCEVMVEKGGYPLAWIGVAGEPDGDLAIRWAAGTTDYLFPGIVSSSATSPRGQGPSGTAFRERVVKVAQNFHTEHNYQPWKDRALEFGVSSAIALPLDVSVPAVLTVYSRHTSRFDAALAVGFGEIVDTVSAASSLLRSVASTEDALEGTIRALAAMTEFRDPYTQGHQRRVGHLSAAIAEQLGLEPPLVRAIQLGALVHDIGKVAIPAEILTRPGRLTSVEFAMVKEHARIGAEVLATASLPSVVSDIARHHHERMDGSGYPDGLAGTEISTAAQIVGVADVFEAMMNHRPYRAALGSDRAREEILAGRATLFNASVVDALVAVLDLGFMFDDLAAPPIEQEMHLGDRPRA